ncbi:ATP-binding protein [Caballeronia sp. LZ065]|uniref:PAS domain-containing hybrid sensor histidine kinase/response regulator n=1 Tax=Caballeronia sp. LZ065 TaxID=3038571 RepID=UPI0028561433|nr:ATP-binding protein [Caballeronia sp. LZ065]MDR5780581.1 ATP-binding protein [Caballeronia sp. LZ065]
MVDGFDRDAEPDAGPEQIRLCDTDSAKGIFESLPVPLLILLPDKDFTVAAASEGYLSETRSHRDDVVGQSILDVYPHSAFPFNSAETADLHAALTSMATWKSASDKADQRFKISAREGEAASRWRAVQRPVLTDEGKLLCIVHWLEKLSSAQRLSLDAAREPNYRRIVDSLPQCIWTARPDGYINYYNARFREFMGAEPEAAKDGLWINFVHPDDVSRAKREWQESLQRGTPHESTFRVRYHTGDYQWTLVRAMPVRQGADIVEWVGSNTDIDARMLAEVEAHVSNRRKDEFLAMLAHELRNPLVPIRAGAEMMARLGKDDERLSHVGDMIRRQVAHVSTLIDDLLEASRVNQNRVSLETDVVDLKRVVHESSEQVRPLVEAHKHQLTVHLPMEPVCVCGDHNRLVQVFSNLLTNAGKYTPDGGSISVSAVRENGKAVLKVKDNGNGMEPDLLRRAFDLFEQGTRSAARTEGGLGLGLALVKGLVERQHGTVTAASEGQGKGSEITVRLPLVAARADRMTPSAPPEPTHDVHRHRILLVEDNVDVADSVGMVLEILGHDVSIEHNSHGAIERARRESFDRCVLGLPDMDGYHLARELRALPGTRNAVFIAHTGYGQQDDKRLSAEAGFKHHLVKPAAIPDLERVLADEAVT